MGRHRKLLGAVALVLTLAAAATACTPATRTSVARECGPTALANQILDLVNDARAANGRGALAWNGQLGCLATEWSEHMASTGRLEHRDLNATLQSEEYSGYRTLGENILRGPSSLTARQMFDAWMASPSHRANILSGAFTSSGIGSAVAADERIYVTQDFGG